MNRHLQLLRNIDFKQEKGEILKAWINAWRTELGNLGGINPSLGENEVSEKLTTMFEQFQSLRIGLATSSDGFGPRGNQMHRDASQVTVPRMEIANILGELLNQPSSQRSEGAAEIEPGAVFTNPNLLIGSLDILNEAISAYNTRIRIHLPDDELSIKDVIIQFLREKGVHTCAWNFKGGYLVLGNNQPDNLDMHQDLTKKIGTSYGRGKKTFGHATGFARVFPEEATLGLNGVKWTQFRGIVAFDAYSNLYMWEFETVNVNGVEIKYIKDSNDRKFICVDLGAFTLEAKIVVPQTSFIGDTLIPIIQELAERAGHPNRSNGLSGIGGGYI